MSIYFLEVFSGLRAAGCDAHLANSENYMNIIFSNGKRGSFGRALMGLASLSGSWIVRYYAFLIILKIYKIEYNFVAISQEYTPIFFESKSIIIVHDLIQLKYPRSLVVWFLYRVIIPRSLRRALGVVSASKTTQDILHGMGIESQKVYNHFIPEAFQDVDAQIDRDPKMVLWVGTDARHKGLHDLLDAASILRDIEFKVVLPVSQIGLNKSSSNVEFLSDLTQESLSMLYRSCGVFVSTSYDEGYGRPAMEARILGAKLVLTDIAIYRELHDKYAYYYGVGDIESLVGAIQHALAHGDERATDNNFPSGLVAKPGELVSVILTMLKSEAGSRTDIFGGRR